MRSPRSLLPCLVLLGLVAASVSLAETATIDFDLVHQRIDGFGASCAYTGSPWSEAQADLFFSVDKGIGLSLLRGKITADVTGTGTAGKMMASEAEISVMLQAQARGARVWVAPWSPPAQFKTSGNTIGGNFLSSNNQAYADMLAACVADLRESRGLNVYAVSVQNEPDWIPTTYEGCGWTGQQFHDFLPFLHASLERRGAGSTRILIPESLSWSNHPNLFTPTLDDPAVSPLAGIIGNHNYDGINEQTGSTAVPAQLPHSGKALWETEVMTSGPFDPGIADALYWAKRIHLFMTAAEANAWHYWWITTTTSNSSLLGPDKAVPKRVYALGQFARFVRPGFYRIEATGTGQALVSAYKDPATGRFAIVAINTTSADIPEMFTLRNLSCDSVTPWLTTVDTDLGEQAAIAASGTSFSATLPANSITTFTGTDSSARPGPSSSRLSNLSVRAMVGSGSNVLTAGLVISGTEPKTVLIRAVGPTLGAFGVSDVLRDPSLKLIASDSVTVVASNTGWNTDNPSLVYGAGRQVGAFDLGNDSTDSALVSTLQPGLYTVQVSSASASAGVVLVEVYELR